MITQSIKNGSRKAALAVMLLAGIFIQACGQKNFSSTDGVGVKPTVFNGNENDNVGGITTDTGGPNCRDELSKITTPVRVHFIVDVSGSNVLRDNGVPPTDPNKSVRGGSIESFFNTYAAKSNFKWGFEIFWGTSARSFINDNSGYAMFGTSTNMSSALDAFANWEDDGATPYLKGISMASSLLTSELSKNPGDTKFIFVFLSDGMPTDGAQDSSVLSQAVSSLVNKAPGRVSFNTVFYGQASQSSYDRLKMMASVGNGNFLDTNRNTTGNAFLISDLVILPGVVCK